jgi:NitT/TauT family transport system substrate-binding protein
LIAVLSLFAVEVVAATPLRLGTNVWPGYEPLYLAADRSSWQGRLNVRLVEYPSATEVLRAFRNRALEAAALTLDEVLMLREAGLPVRVVTVLDISHGGDVILARPEISSFSALRDKRIGVEATALGAYVLSRALQLHGLSLDEIVLVRADADEHEGLYLAGDVDAVVTFEPVRTRLLAAGARELFSSVEIPGEIVDVLVVHADVAESKPGIVRAMVSDWFAALAYMETEAHAAAQFTAKRLRISPGEVIASYEGLKLPDVAENRRLLGGGLEPTVQRLHHLLVDESLLQGPVDTRDLLSPALLPE